MKRNDLFLLMGVLLISALGFLGFSIASKNTSAKVVVTVDGEEFGIYSLEEEQEIQINDTNRLVIRNGKADMVSADCPDQICVDQRAISRDLETLICLPNKVIVQITDGEQAEVDSVTN